MLRGITRAVTALIVLGAAVPGAARTPATTASLTDPATAEASARAILETVARGSASEILRDSFALQGSDPTPARLRAGDPITTLLNAIQVAEGLRSAATSRVSSAEQRLVLERPLRSVPIDPSSEPADQGTSLVLDERLELRPRLLAIARRVDVDGLARAAVTLVAAVEQATPGLETVPQQKLAPATCPGITGDVIFESDDCSIIIAGQAANTYDVAADPMLLVDLGGNDLYRGDTAFAEQTIEVVLDVAGNDTYARTAAFSTPGDNVAMGAQGGGALGVGVLADMGGNDAYLISMDASAPEPGPVARAVGPTGQGTGVIGAGVLLDAGGTDAYAIQATSSGGSARLMGQAAGVGAAALLDLGTENDSWEMAATSTLHETIEEPNKRTYRIGTAAAAGQGAGVLGVAAAVDAAGDDTFSAVATGAETDVSAQGAGIGGAGLLIDGAGNDRLAARAVGDVRLGVETTKDSMCWEAGASVTTAAAVAFGQGAAAIGAGVLIDGGGDDERALESSNRTEAFATVRSALSCTGSLRNAGEATAHAGPGTAIGQAASQATAVAALVDLGGSDRYTLSGVSDSIATVTISSPGPDTATTSSTAEDGVTQGQGYNVFGAAVLLDVAGNDTYDSVTRTETTETKTIDGVTTAISSLVPGDERIQGYSEGVVFAWLIDLDGDDTYSSFAGATAGDDDSCWNNNAANDDGRGRDLSLAVPAGCL